MQIDFNSSPGPSLGIEVELELVDRATGELASAATDILTVMGEGHPGGEHPKAKHELFECTVEIITGVCQSVAEARADLEGTLAELRKETDARGLEVLCSGSHPFSRWQDQTVSAPGGRGTARRAGLRRSGDARSPGPDGPVPPAPALPWRSRPGSRRA